MHQRRHIDLNEFAAELTERRFDGGTEINLIAQIEARQEQGELPKTAKRNPVAKAGRASVPRGVTPQSDNARNTTLQEAVTAIPLQNRTQPNRVKMAMDTLLVGPLQIAVGAVGILTSGLAMASFCKSGDESLQQQSRAIFRDCSLTLLIGMFYTLVSPLRCLKTLVLGPTIQVQ